jgi:transcriptional regulator with XRE-family HTH domain
MRIELIQARRAQGLTQQQLGTLIGRDQGTVSRYEKGDVLPDPAIALKLAEALCIAPAVVVFGPPPVAEPMQECG